MTEPSVTELAEFVEELAGDYADAVIDEPGTSASDAEDRAKAAKLHRVATLLREQAVRIAELEGQERRIAEAFDRAIDKVEAATERRVKLRERLEKLLA